MIGQVVGHYRVVSALGRGGMGEVFLAEDLKLGRQVALKFLPQLFAAGADARERFVREARAASSLDHPSICTVHEIDETPDGQLFIAMAYYEGETLRARVARGPLEPVDAALVALAVATGLERAHEAGIVHRDIKPANVILTSRGGVKIVDFGLAKLAGEEGQTAAGVTLGTAHYMSPEQALARQVDARSDLWSLGVVLFQMLTGQLPFDRESLPAVVAAICNQDAPALRSVRPGLPVELERVVSRALRRDPAARYQRAADMAADLRAYLGSDASSRTGSGEVSELSDTVRSSSPSVGPRVWPSRAGGTRKRQAVAMGAGALLLGLVVAATWWWAVRPDRDRRSADSSGRTMVVVMPFANLGPAEDAYLAAGISEEITSALTGVRGLGVISRTSAAAYDRAGKSARTIGEDLAVDYVLEGSVQWARAVRGQGRVRITPRLVRVADETEVWSQGYERVVDDIFALQSDIAVNVVKALGGTLVSGEGAELVPSPTANFEAYQAYLQGLEAARRPPSVETDARAVTFLERAVGLDPGFAPAWAGLARAHARTVYMYGDRAPARVARAHEAADTAIRLAPALAEAHLALGYVLYWVDRDLDGAARAMAEAERLRPGDSEVLYAAALLLRRRGHFEEALVRFEEAFRLSPREPRLEIAVCGTLASLRRYQEAFAASDRVVELLPEHATTYLDRAQMRVRWQGDLAGAEAELDRVEQAEDPYLANCRFLITLYRRDYANGLAELRALPWESLVMVELRPPRALLEAQLLRLLGQEPAARVAFERAREVAQRALGAEPEDARLFSALGLALAGLGRHDEALAAGRRGTELQPRATDALVGPYRELDLALIAVAVGETGLALTCLEELLTKPGEISAWDLHLDPRWDRLRSDPRFRHLVGEGSEPYS